MQRSRIVFFALSALAGSVALAGCGQAQQASAPAAQAMPVGAVSYTHLTLPTKA